MLRLIAALMGPIFAKEMVEMARRKRYYFNRVLYGLVLLFTLFVIWDNYRWRLEHQGAIRMAAEMAEALFHGISGVQYGAVFLLVPLFLCGVIASEREEQTLELLFTTQLSDREIVLGKLASRVAALVLLILCALPVMSLILFFGGVDPEGVWRILAATLLAILYAGAHAIYFSVVTRSPIGALVRTYWWLAVWMLLMPYALLLPVAALTRGPGHPAFQYVLGFIIFTNPGAPFILALERHEYDSLASHLGPWFFPFTFAVPAAWSFFLIWRAVRRLRLAPTPFLRLVNKISVLVWIREARHRRAEARARRRAARAARVGRFFPVRNPLWLRARQARVYDREGYIGRIEWLAWLVAGFFLVLIAILALFDSPGFRYADLPIGFLAPTWLAAAALAAILAGTSLVSDRRKGFLELVLVTPLPARQVIDGTLLAIWEHWRRIYGLALVLALFFSLTGAANLAGVLCSLATATLFCLVLLIHGVACALAARTLPGSLVPTFLFPVLMTVGIVLLLPLFGIGSGPVLWFAGAFFLIVSSVWVRRTQRPGPAAVGCYFMAVHLALVAAATCWTWGYDREGYPITVMNPGVLTLKPLDRWGSSLNWFHPGPRATQLFPCYWAALLVNFLWARWWLIRHFERLAGRVLPGTEKPRRVRPEPLAVPLASSS